MSSNLIIFYYLRISYTHIVCVWLNSFPFPSAMVPSLSTPNFMRLCVYSFRVGVLSGWLLHRSQKWRHDLCELIRPASRLCVQHTSSLWSSALLVPKPVFLHVFCRRLRDLLFQCVVTRKWIMGQTVIFKFSAILITFPRFLRTRVLY